MVVSFILYPLPHPEGRGLRGTLRSAVLFFDRSLRPQEDLFFSITLIRQGQYLFLPLSFLRMPVTIPESSFGTARNGASRAKHPVSSSRAWAAHTGLSLP